MTGAEVILGTIGLGAIFLQTLFYLFFIGVVIWALITFASAIIKFIWYGLVSVFALGVLTWLLVL
jgi:hypothetical protein